MSMKVQIKAEFGSRPVHHLAIQCPTCKKWFKQGDVVSTAWISTESDIDKFAKCECPACGCKFDLGNVECDDNVEFPKFYDNCAAKKTVWE